MPVYTDQTGNTIYINNTPQRIVSLVPSQTELLSDLGLDQEVAGITKFCVHPEQWFRNKTRVGGTKNLRIEEIIKLRPDLVIANKEENVKEQVELLSAEFPVWVSDVNNLDEALEMIRSIGEITAKNQAADKLADKIKLGFASLSKDQQRIKCCYLIWKDPFMTIGGDTFIHDMLEHAGFGNIFSDRKRYPEISFEEIGNCDVLLLSSEPYPFKEKHVEEFRQMLPAIKVVAVDGEMFSWYGSRLLKAPSYFGTLRNQILSLAHGGNP